MKVSDAGEFGLIEALAGLVNAGEKGGEAWSNLIIGVGDDAAAWRCRTGSQLATIDALVENVHFKLGTISWEELGWKSLAINVSDIAAMGGIPRYALVSLTLPGETNVDDVLALYRGMLALSGRFDIAVVGGNISSGPIVTVNIVVTGEEGRPGRLMTRAGARARDKLAVTGSLGRAAAGLHVLMEEPDIIPELAAALRESFVRPMPRVTEGLALVAVGVSAAIDLSDGLVSDLDHICKASHLGAQINVDDLPVDADLRENFGDLSLQWALSGGEDYELLFSAPEATIEEVRRSLRCPVTVIGNMISDQDEKVVLFGRDGAEMAIAQTGWDHFPREKHGD